MKNNKSGSTTTTSTSAPSLRDQRNQAIRADYNHLFTNEGKRCAVILTLLSTKYFMRPDTIERIVFQRGNYRNLPSALSSLSAPMS